MQIRKWKIRCLAVGLVAILAPRGGFAQETESDSTLTAPLTAVISMIWNQLGLDAQAENAAPALPENMGGSISPDGVAAEGTSNDMGGSISPDG